MIILSQVFIIYVIAAVLPAIILLVYIYNQDTVEKEPMDLLIKLLLLGVAAALCAIVLEEIGEGILNSLISTSSRLYVVFLAFLVVAVAEEGAKFFFLNRATWRNPNFNYTFDGIVYAVFVSLGFAAFENIGYVFGYGLTVAPARALLAIPGHCSFAVFMGYFYGRAKKLEQSGDPEGARKSKLTGYLVAVFLHGFYDACAMSATALSSVIFIVFIIAMYYFVFRTVKYESRHDSPV